MRPLGVVARRIGGTIPRLIPRCWLRRRVEGGAISQLARPGFRVAIYETVEDFYCAEGWNTSRLAAGDRRPPGGDCGADWSDGAVCRSSHASVNALDIKFHDAHFWGMDEWVENGRGGSTDSPLSFARADMELCFNRIRPDLDADRRISTFQRTAPYSRRVTITTRCASCKAGRAR